MDMSEPTDEQMLRFFGQPAFMESIPKEYHKFKIYKEHINELKKYVNILTPEESEAMHSKENGARARTRIKVSLVGKQCEVCGIRNNFLQRHHHDGYDGENGTIVHILCYRHHKKAEAYCRKGIPWDETLSELRVIDEVFK